MIHRNNILDLYKNPGSILALPREEQDTLFASMPVEDVLNLSLLLPWKMRLKFLELSPRFKEVIRAYPPQELYWTIKAIGPRDAISILKAMPLDTLQLVFDLEWWEKDTLLAQKVILWMILLFEASESIAVKWINWIWKRDESLPPLLFRTFLDVAKRPDDMEIQEARDILGPFTLDDVYYFKFKTPTSRPLWGRFLALCLSSNPGLYRDILESVLWETRLEQLESAFRWRRARLADHGIPDYYEAIDILAYTPGLKVRRIDVKAIDSLSPSDSLLSFVPTLYCNERTTALFEALDALKGTSHMEMVINQWIGIANKLIVAKASDLDEPEELRDSLLESASLINLGLEILWKREGLAFQEALKSVVLEDIVHLGLTAVKEVTLSLVDIVRDPDCTLDLYHLPDGLRERCLGLLKEPPRLWNEDTYNSRPFTHIQDIDTARDICSIALDLWRAARHLSPYWSLWEELIPWEKTNIKDVRELDWSTALMTAISNQILGMDPLVSPIAENDLFDLFVKLISIHDLKHVLTLVLGEDILFSGPFLKYIEKKRGEILEDWEDAGRPRDIDGRFVKGILVRLDRSSGQI